MGRRHGLHRQRWCHGRRSHFGGIRFPGGGRCRGRRNFPTVAAALGVVSDASEETLVAALAAGFVEKRVHEETLSQLNSATTELAQIKATERQSRVDALLEGALKEKKMLPAERDHYASLCATDAGLETVKSLLAARAAALPASNLDKKEAPNSGGMPTAAQLALEADKMLKDGLADNIVEAVTKLQDKYAAA